MKKIPALTAVAIFTLVAFIVPIYADDEPCTETGCGPSVTADTSQQSQEIQDLTYEEFVHLKNSGEKFTLVDVRPKESFLQGHIEGALSMPLGEMFPETISTRLSLKDKIVVYCGSASCSASKNAAIRLHELGYHVLHFKGGVQEWTLHGNTLEKIEFHE